MGYGNFITVLIGFIIIAWVLFMIMKALNRMNLSKPKAPPEPTRQEILLTEIRDLLASKPQA